MKEFDLDGPLADVLSLMERLCRGTGDDVAGLAAVEHLRTGGKRLRARLALAAGVTLGLPARTVVPWAAACELLHNGTLVHDDLQDGDTVRRGQPTVWARHGAAQAINVGDLLFSLPYQAVAELAVATGVKHELCVLLSQQSVAVVRGQSVEQAMLGRRETSWERYVEAVTGKTSALFELPARGAALLAGLSEEKLEACVRPFRRLGLLFQLQDDVLDLYGDKGRGTTGSDLREGKVSALVAAHLRRYPGERDEIIALLEMPRDATPDELVHATIARFREGGALRDVLDAIRALAAGTEEDAAQSGEEGLHKLAQELLTRALDPISSLLV